MKKSDRKIKKSPNAHWDAYFEEEIFTPHLTVFEEEGGPQHTGLIDKNGNPLMRTGNKRKIGFI